MTKERRKENPEIGQFYCEECERYFDTDEQYREHNRKQHKEKEMEEPAEVGRTPRR
jgi:Zinc-finger double-stranded RNA-binding